MTKPEIVAFVRDKSDPDVVACAERLLESAKSGRLRSIAFCGLNLRDDGVSVFRTGAYGTCNQVELIGNIEMMKCKIAANFLKNPIAEETK